MSCLKEVSSAKVKTVNETLRGLTVSTSPTCDCYLWNFCSDLGFAFLRPHKDIDLVLSPSSLKDASYGVPLRLASLEDTYSLRVDFDESTFRLRNNIREADVD